MQGSLEDAHEHRRPHDHDDADPDDEGVAPDPVPVGVGGEQQQVHGEVGGAEGGPQAAGQRRHHGEGRQQPQRVLR
jgi:hypothetical protein